MNVSNEYLEENYRNENGNVIVEFIAFLSLFLLPLIIFFSQVTADSVSKLRDEEIFREIAQIISSGDDFAQSISVSKRYLTLHNSLISFEAFCISGLCPRRGSLMKINFEGTRSRFEIVVQGGQWS